jgi:hypothetical protein
MLGRPRAKAKALGSRSLLQGEDVVGGEAGEEEGEEGSGEESGDGDGSEDLRRLVALNRVDLGVYAVAKRLFDRKFNEAAGVDPARVLALGDRLGDRFQFKRDVRRTEPSGRPNRSYHTSRTRASACLEGAGCKK